MARHAYYPNLNESEGEEKTEKPYAEDLRITQIRKPLFFFSASSDNFLPHSLLSRSDFQPASCHSILELFSCEVI